MARVFFFIRHGQSQSNAGIKTEHPQSVALTEKGHMEAEEKARCFLQRPELIVTSRYIRTQQTAEPFLRKFANVSVEEWNIHEFTFLSPARYKDTTSLDRWPSIEEYWKNADPDYRDDEASETFREFAGRCLEALARMKSCTHETAVAFSHGYVMKGILFALRGGFDTINTRVMCDFWQYHLDNKIGNCAELKFLIEENQSVTLSSHEIKNGRQLLQPVIVD